ncbi:MAG: hypothetical protein FJ224_11305, partial [Lentisphaerae bacterium]|nr:hypothetical protein [Lentisphaerota bacterium]
MTTRLLDPEEFMSHQETLENPDDSAVRDAFARLPKRAFIEVRCRWERRLDLQRMLTEMGAFAICLRPLADFAEIQITALKGKAGACFETGRSASYLGVAQAVMDDDHHLIVGTIRVCEKTGGLYTLPPYRGLLTVTEGDPGLLARLETDPLPFDCNTFEPDAERLAALSFISAMPNSAMTAVYYPGPFSLLVLRDGSILRRGHCALIASSLAGKLLERDGLLAVPDRCSQEAERPVNYPEAYRRLGAGCLLESDVTTAPDTARRKPSREDVVPPEALDTLRGVSAALRRRLVRLIEGNEPYFILTGSDPKDPLGCCPNTQVGEANRLVDAGVLCSYAENAAADSCTTTIYAFAGEISVRDGPEFAVNAAIRTKATAVMTRTDRGRHIRRMALKCALLALVGASFVIAGRVALAPLLPAKSGFDRALATALGVPSDTRCLFVCLFHGRETCEACETMEKLCRQT